MSECKMITTAIDGARDIYLVVLLNLRDQWDLDKTKAFSLGDIALIMQGL